MHSLLIGVKTLTDKCVTYNSSWKRGSKPELVTCSAQQKSQIVAKTSWCPLLQSCNLHLHYSWGNADQQYLFLICKSANIPCCPPPKKTKSRYSMPKRRKHNERTDNAHQEFLKEAAGTGEHSKKLMLPHWHGWELRSKKLGSAPKGLPPMLGPQDGPVYTNHHTANNHHTASLTKKDYHQHPSHLWKHTLLLPSKS